MVWLYPRIGGNPSVLSTRSSYFWHVTGRTSFNPVLPQPPQNIACLPFWIASTVRRTRSENVRDCDQNFASTSLNTRTSYSFKILSHSTGAIYKNPGGDRLYLVFACGFKCCFQPFPIIVYFQPLMGIIKRCFCKYRASQYGPVPYLINLSQIIFIFSLNESLHRKRRGTHPKLIRQPS